MSSILKKTVDLFHEGGVDLIRDVLDAAVCHACFKVTGLDVCKDIQFLDLRQNFRSGLSGDLATIVTVDLSHVDDVGFFCTEEPVGFVW